MQSKSKEIKAVKRCIVKRAIKNTIQVGLVVALMQAEEDVDRPKVYAFWGVVLTCVLVGLYFIIF